MCRGRLREIRLPDRCYALHVGAFPSLTAVVANEERRPCPRNRGCDHRLLADDRLKRDGADIQIDRHCEPGQSGAEQL